MQALLTLPSGPLAEACVSLARTTESLPIVDHSIRSFLYARLLAEHEGSLADAAYDEGLLFAACILHDLGLGTGALGNARFEVEGADLAAALLGEYGVAARDIDVGHETHIPLERLHVVRNTYPRPANDRSIRDPIVEHASRSEAAAPPYSIAAELLRQKRAEG